MRRVFDKLASLVLYHVGDTICDLFFWKHFQDEWVIDHMYRVYSWCILKSVKLQRPELENFANSPSGSNVIEPVHIDSKDVVLQPSFDEFVDDNVLMECKIMFQEEITQHWRDRT